MDRIIEGVFVGNTGNLELVFHRFYTTLGKIYLDAGFEDLTIKYFSEASRSVEDFGDFTVKDLNNYRFIISSLRHLLRTKILFYREHNDSISEAGIITSYLKLSRDQELSDRLKYLYKQNFRYKNYRRLLLME